LIGGLFATNCIDSLQETIATGMNETDLNDCFHENSYDALPTFELAGYNEGYNLPNSSWERSNAMKAVGAYKKLFGLFLVTVTVLTIMGVFIHLSLQDREADRWVTHTYEVQSRLQATLLDVEAAQDAHETYRINHSAEALSTLNASLQKASVDLNILEQLPLDTPDQYARLEPLRRSIMAYRMAVESPGKETMLPSGQPALIQEFILLDKVHRVADSMKQAEQDLLEERIHANRVSQLRVNIALAAFLMMVSMLLVALFNAVRQDIFHEQVAERLRHTNDERIANILENMSDGFYTINKDWVVTDMNEQAERLLDRKRSEILGMQLGDVYPEAVGTEFETQYRRALEEKHPVRFEAYYPPHSAWYAITIHPYDDGLAVFVTNVNERRKADEERERLARQEMLHTAAQRRNQELQDLARRLVEMQEAERRHLAFELHEEIGQVLAGLKLSLATVMKLPDEGRDNQIRSAQNLVTELMRQVRALSLDLRPGVLDDLGLLPALQWYCRHYTEQTEVAVDFAATGLEVRLDGTVETTAYRIVQEALANIAYHAKVKVVEVRLDLQKAHLMLQITDHSDAPASENSDCFCDHSSLTGMQQRASLIGGTFAVTSRPDLGTTICASLPIHPVYTSLES